jgi:transposase
VLGSTRNLVVYASHEPADMRKGYDGLFALVRDVIRRDPLSGQLFVFVAKNRKRAKVLFWDGTGLCIYQKRLERGRFAAPWLNHATATLTTSELALFLEGGKNVLHLSPAAFLLPRK